ncbi:FAD-binding oxidoreductase [Bordetella sp. N]|uniref:NAD(P)/FAD-dependent oxidoreductase n=1 Tax=Bordetella sp. N TaxID=1746199 RepID=UPI000709A249|nr:FAD-dependent oxidoreductase [Bordetella sp. N]ALM82797.1 amino acid dehydrogenase [Bordetella sp. N]
MSNAPHVVVIGAGAVGAAVAMRALEAGLRVTLVEPDAPGGRQAASYGNAGWLSSHSILPPAEPGVWRKVPKWIADPLGPLAVRWRYLPSALPWLWRYLRAAWTWPRVERTAHALRTLLRDAPALHQQQAAWAGVSELIEQRGLLHVFLNEAQFRADKRAWDIRRAEGIEWEELDAQALRAREPALDARYTFGVWVPETGSCRDPGRYVAALVSRALALGAELHTTRATGFHIEDGRLLAVRTEHGEIPCDKAVIATGVHARALAGQAGDRVPLAAERGYHVVIRDAPVGVHTSAQFADAKMVVNWTDQGLRAAGQVEIAAPDAAPNWERARILRRQLVGIFPELSRAEAVAGASAQAGLGDEADFWLGCRPSMPDGLPCIGPASASADIVHAYGHGHVGLVSSARTGRLVVQVLMGTPTDIDLRPFSPRRFA